MEGHAQDGIIVQRKMNCIEEGKTKGCMHYVEDMIIG